MNRAKDLTVAYLRAHPREAARVLEQLSAADASALLTAMPGRVAAPVVARLPPGFAARSLASLADEAVVRLLRRLTTPAIAALLRHLPEERRARLLDELPAATAVACRMLLRYPEDSIAALADTEVLTARPADAVREVLARLKAAADDVGDFLYIVDDERRLRATVRPASLLHASPSMSVAAVEAVEVPALPAQAAPHSVRDHAGWTRFSTLPVVERNGRLVGALRQGVLIQVLERGPRLRARRDASSLAAFARGAWSLMAALLQALVNELPGAPRRGGQ
jgi:magnesium transporter